VQALQDTASLAAGVSRKIMLSAYPHDMGGMWNDMFCISEYGYVVLNYQETSVANEVTERFIRKYRDELRSREVRRMKIPMSKSYKRMKKINVVYRIGS